MIFGTIKKLFEPYLATTQQILGTLEEAKLHKNISHGIEILI